MSSSKTLIHLTALDGLINVNSLFTLAVFIGLAWNPYDPSNTLISPTSPCYQPPTTARDLIAYHVYSFSSFLFSSLVALALKQAIRITHSPDYHLPSYLSSLDFPARIDRNILRAAMLVSGAGSVSGCGFLMMALFKVVEIKLGTLGCGSGHSAIATTAIFGLVPLGMAVYVSMVLYAFTREAMKLAPCMSAAQDAGAPVSSGCCAQVQKIGQNPGCLCAAMLSNLAKAAGIKPEVAITIPKRCNLADRPVGYHCGTYTLP